MGHRSLIKNLDFDFRSGNLDNPDNPYSKVIMALPVSASRFAVLPDDFLDDKVKKIRKPKKETDTSFAFLNESNKKGKQAKKPASEADKLRQDAFAAGSGKKKNKKRNKANSNSSDSKNQNEMSPPPAPTIPPQPDSQQFQEWKQSGTKAVEDSFEKDIEKALMLSMIEAEHDREVAKEKEVAKAAAAAASRKTMSLEEFNRLLEPVPAAPMVVALPPGQPHLGRAAAPSTILEHRHLAEQERDFFSNVDQGAKKIVNREKIRDQIQKMHLEMAAQKERETVERVTADGAKRDAELERLHVENEGLRADLAKVKGRYKTMRGLLEEAEVKSRAELAAEVVKLRSVNDEVMSEVGRLTEELEQSRTRVRDLENTVKLLMEKRPKPTS